MTDNENKELFKAAAREAEELHGVSLAEIMSNPDKYERFDEPSSNAMMCAAAAESEDVERIKKELEDTKEELERLRKFHSEMVLGIYAFLEDSEVERPTAGDYPDPKDYHPDEPNGHFPPSLMAKLERAQLLVDHPVRLSVGGPSKTVKEAYIGDASCLGFDVAVYGSELVVIDFTDNTWMAFDDLMRGVK